MPPLSENFLDQVIIANPTEVFSVIWGQRSWHFFWSVNMEVVILGCSSWEEPHETPAHSQLLLMRKQKTSLIQDHLARKKQRQIIASVSLRAEGAEGSASHQALLTLQVTTSLGMVPGQGLASHTSVRSDSGAWR